MVFSRFLASKAPFDFAFAGFDVPFDAVVGYNAMSQELLSGAQQGMRNAMTLRYTIQLVVSFLWEFAGSSHFSFPTIDTTENSSLLARGFFSNLPSM